MRIYIIDYRFLDIGELLQYPKKYRATSHKRFYINNIFFL